MILKRGRKSIRVGVICPSCQHSFSRSFRSAKKKKTRCPKCKELFFRTDGIGLKEKHRLEKLAKIQQTKRDRFKQADKTRRGAALESVKKIEDGNLPALSRAIKGKQVPGSPAEAIFKVWAAENDLIPHRPSWPDFLVTTAEEIFAVEVKGPRDSVKESQAKTFSLLEKCGLKVFIWWEKNRMFQRWKE